MSVIRTGIYVRVSTEEQAKEGYSIRAQQEKLRDYVRIKDWELYDIYVDEGISGKNIEGRPEVNRLISDVMQKKVQNVLVFKIDRLTRSTKDLITLMETFKENDCAFNSLMESIDTRTASGRMFIKIIGIFAEFERENLIERVSVAFEKKAREGYTNVSYNIVPYGYSREIGQREITVNEEERRIVGEIYSMYVNKHITLTAIARTLNMRGVLSKSGGTWTTCSIKYILTNPIYIGKVRYSINDKSRYFEADGKHEAIISEEIFAEAQRKIAIMQKKEIKKRPKENNYYCGTLYCGECGNKMTTHSYDQKDKDGNLLHYCSYICTQKSHGTCNSGSISHKKTEIAFREYIEKIKDFNAEDKTPAAPINRQKITQHKKKNMNFYYLPCLKKKSLS